MPGVSPHVYQDVFRDNKKQTTSWIKNKTELCTSFWMVARRPFVTKMKATQLIPRQAWTWLFCVSVFVDPAQAGNTNKRHWSNRNTVRYFLRKALELHSDLCVKLPLPSVLEQNPFFLLTQCPLLQNRQDGLSNLNTPFKAHMKTMGQQGWQ